MRKTSQVTLGTSKAGKHLNVRVVPVLKDNYSYVLWQQSPNEASPRKLALIDVSNDFEPVLREAKDILKGAELTARNIELFGTHKHHDHIGGFASLVSKFGDKLRVVGGEHEPVPHKNELAKEGTQLRFDEDVVIDSYHVPFHTRGHVLYHFFHPENRETQSAVFTGDAIFVGGGLGAMFDGKTSEIVDCFRKAASKLPKTVSMFCGHDYMKNFIGYAASLQPTNELAQQLKAKCAEQNAHGVPTVPTTLEQELAISPFFKAALGDKEFLQNVVPASDRVDVEKAVEWAYNNCP